MMRMLLCTIGSEQQEATVRFGLEVARALSADTTLLGIVDTDSQIQALEQPLERSASRTREGGLPVQTRVVVGDAESAVMAEMEATAYDLIALGSLARKRSRRRILTSVAMRIIERAQSSVLVIKGDRPSLSSVLICSSGTGFGHLAVWAGAALACGAGARATILHVVDAMPSMYAGLEQMEETLAELLQSGTERSKQLRWATQVVKAECEISELKLRRGLVAEEILREGRDGNHDVLVIGSSVTGGGLVRALMGDLTREIVSRAQTPVLVVRPME